VFANATAEIGSIGTIAVVEDTSGAAEMAGIKVHVVATGPKKAGIVDGLPVTEEMLQDVRARATAFNAFFLKGVSYARGMSIEEVEKLATGETWMAAEAKALNLIDAVQTLDDTLMQMHELINKREQNQRRSGRARSLRSMK
jgi:protease-4